MGNSDTPNLQLSELLERMEEFGCSLGDAVDYTEVHFGRYIATLNLLPDLGDARILELGGSYPYAFTPLLAGMFPDARISLAEYAEQELPGQQTEAGASSSTVRLENRVTGEKLLFERREFNVEVDTWPYEDNTFDLVLCMEIVEHLLLDPCFAFPEGR